MHWKVKSMIQRAISLLPDQSSYAFYYWVQRNFGRISGLNPSYGFYVATETWKRLLKFGFDPRGKVFFEVGTGRAPIVPIAFYLMGAVETITVDLNPYLKKELIASALRHVADNSATVPGLFGDLLDADRWARVVEVARRGATDVEGFLRECGIRYVAPADAANTSLPVGSVDFHTSNTTLEHIPRDVLVRILKEGGRILRNGGALIHRVDYSDHFAHTDKSISLINFLQYSERSWAKYAANRYMYMNRLRHDDLLAAFEASGNGIIAAEPDVNTDLLDNLRSGKLQVAPEFRVKPLEVLATTGAWIIARPGTAESAGIAA